MADYNKFKEVPPTIKEFKEAFDSIADECSVDGVYINSHKIKSNVLVICEGSDDEYELVGMDVSMLFGCGCWADPKIVIRKVS